MLTRGILRSLLSRYIGQSPETITFTYNEFGKPRLNTPPSLTQAIEFNLAHSHDRAAFAFTLNTPVGVDLEYKKQRKHIDKIAYRFFPACDYKQLTELTGEAKLNALFTMWVRNEAILKAFGYPLQTHPFSKYGIQNKHLIKPLIEKNTYSFSFLALHSKFAAALAIKGNANKSVVVKKYNLLHKSSAIC